VEGCCVDRLNPPGQSDIDNAAQSSRLAEFGGLGMSFNICRGTLGSLAIFTAMPRRDNDGLQLVFGAPGQLQSLAGLDHDRTIPSADALFDRPVRR